MGSQRLGVTAKLDLVEVRTGADDLFNAIEVCPVDYKAGAPREGDDGNELWDADQMQLGLQALILRENGYTCREGVIYYRATKQRVRLPITPELENWVTENVARARAAAVGAIPPPLMNSPKCPRCSLVTVCLPDETRVLYLNTQGLRIGRKDEVLQVREPAARGPGRELPRRRGTPARSFRARPVGKPTRF